MKIKLAISKLFIALIIIVMVIVSFNLNWGSDNWKGIIEADAKGYYAYLPAVFIYQDLNFGFFEKIEKEKYYNKNHYYEYRIGSNGEIINKYYCGTALVEMPFFLIAHYLSYLMNYETDGYSRLYPIFINIAAIFYLLLGLIFLNRTLKHYGINEWVRVLILVVSVFGTNLFYYTVVEPGISHVFSYAFISMFIFYTKEYFHSFQRKHILSLAIILGIITLIRPVNVLVVFIIPFLSGDFENLKKGVLNAIKARLQLIIGLIIFIVIVSIQFIIYKLSTGQFFVYSYGEEGFNFLSPHMFDILFSYRKGLFLYTPLFLISLTGGYFLWKQSLFEFYSWFSFFILITYVFSSWWMWYYGGSFSARVYVEFIPLFMILLAIALSEIKKKLLKGVLVTAIVLITVLCQIQTYQYRYYQIHWSDMNKEKYWDVFLRIDKIVSKK